MNRNEVKEKLTKILEEILEEDNLSIDDESTLLVDGLGLDSMGYLELSVQIRRVFNVTISNEEFQSHPSFRELTDLIQEKTESDEK